MSAVLRLFIDTLRGDPLIKQEERTDLAMKAVAKCQGDIADTRVMVAFYGEMVTDTDPHTEWWLFARRRQKLEDHEQELAVLNDNLARLYARLDDIRSKTP